MITLNQRGDDADDVVSMTRDKNSVEQVWPTSGLANKLLHSTPVLYILYIAVGYLIKVTCQYLWRNGELLTQFLNTGFNVDKQQVGRV